MRIIIIIIILQTFIMSLILLLNASHEPDSVCDTLQSAKLYTDKSIVLFTTPPSKELINKMTEIIQNVVIIVKEISIPNNSEINKILFETSKQYNYDYSLIMKSPEILITSYDKKELIQFLKTSKNNMFCVRNVNKFDTSEVSIIIYQNNEEYIWEHKLREIPSPIKNVAFIKNIIVKNSPTIPSNIIEEYEKYLIENNLINNYSMFSLGKLYYNVDNFEKSSEYFKKRIELLTLHNEDNEFYVSCLKIASIMQQNSEKIFFLKKAIIYIPQRLEAYFYLAIVYILDKNYVEANKICNSTYNRLYNYMWQDLELDIYEYKFDYNMAVIMENMGRINEAYALISGLANKFPDKENISKLEGKLRNMSSIVIANTNNILNVSVVNFYDKLDLWNETIQKLKYINGYSDNQFTVKDQSKLESLVGKKILNVHQDNGKFVKTDNFEYNNNYNFAIVNLGENCVNIMYDDMEYNLSKNCLFLQKLNGKKIKINKNNICKIFLFT
jgi:tetratricopeptide (TPR) repeat protein